MANTKLSELLQKESLNAPLNDLIQSLLKECRIISDALRGAKVEVLESTNEFGDVQLSVDILAEKLLTQWAKQNPLVRAISSEETTTLDEVHQDGSFVLCWDPLDGSSIIDCNWSVGTIVAIWQIGENRVEWNGTHTLEGVTGRQQVASAIIVYGPRTTCLLTVAGKTFDLLYRPEGDIICTDIPKIKTHGAKIFAPANLRSAQDLDAYKRLIDYYMTNRFTLRYTGGLVPDVYQIFVKKQGIFCNPASAAAPAKLRLVYEVAPIANIVEAAGGKTSDGKKSLLDLPIQGLDHRTSFCCGTAEEVERFERELAN